MEPTVNYLAVLLGGVASMIIGFVWYSRLLFGPTWARLMGHTDESLRERRRGMVKLFVGSFILALATSYLLAHVIELSFYFYGGSTLRTGVMSAFFMWLGFVMPTQFTGEMFGGKRWGALLHNTGYQLAWLIAAGVIIGLMHP